MQQSHPCRGCGATIFRTGARGEIRRYCSAACRPQCSVVECVKPVHSKGMCASHNERARRLGDPLAPLVRHPQRGACSVEGCDQPRRKTGWCASHYQQARHSGKAPAPFRYKWASERRCVVCGVTDTEPGRRRYCSAKCQAMFHRHAGRRPEAVACVSCGGQIDLLHDLTRAGQRRNCTTKLCRRCRQDKRKHGLSVEILAQRDGADCGICDTPVDMALRAPHKMRASVDHVLPRARGGTNDPTNLQLAHLWCNQVKSDRIEVASRVG